MDKNSPVKEDTSEVARELLIAISESVPDKLLNSNGACEKLDGFHGSVAATKDKAEELRSKLISISYVSSPNNIAQPAIGQPDGLSRMP